MKKQLKKLVVIAVAVLFSANVSAQTLHNQYLPQAGSNFLSFVNTTNPISYESWYIFTDDAKRVIINKMDYNMFCPDADNTWTYNLDTSLGKIYFKDCLFVPDGSAIFCYGWEDSLMQGVMLRININAAGAVAGINFSYLDQPNTPITSACWANNTTGDIALYGNYCFGIIAANKAARIFVTRVGAFGILGIREIFNNPPLFYFPLYSICYDPVQDYFLVSGTFKTNHVLFTKIQNNPAFSQVSAYPNHFVLGNSFLYNFEDGDVSNNVMTITDNGTLFLAQSIHTYNNLYLIWLIKYNYYTNTMLSSTLYTTPSKSYLSNIAVDYGNNIYILGHYNADINRKFLFQIDMQNSATNYRMQYMTDAVLSLPSFYSREIEYLSSISFSNLFFSMDVSGAINGEAFIVHASNLHSNNCDNEVDVDTLPHSLQNPNSVIDLYSNQTFFPAAKRTTIASYTLNPCSELCQSRSPRQLQELKSQIEERLQERNKTMQKPQPQIKIMQKQFIVDNFEGNCKFKIVDILGRTMQQGNTQNGVINNINVSTSGIYIISVTDEKNNIQNSKVFISQ